MASEIRIDAFPPKEMAQRMEKVGVDKALLDTWTMFVLAILAGAFIGSGAIFATVVSTGLAEAGMGYGVIKLLTGLSFCLGLIAVIVMIAVAALGESLVTYFDTLAEAVAAWGEGGTG